MVPGDLVQPDAFETAAGLQTRQLVTPGSELCDLFGQIFAQGGGEGVQKAAESHHRVLAARVIHQDGGGGTLPGRVPVELRVVELECIGDGATNQLAAQANLQPLDDLAAQPRRHRPDGWIGDGQTVWKLR